MDSRDDGKKSTQDNLAQQTVLSLPQEIITLILSYLPPTEAIGASQVSHRIKEFVKDDKFWHMLLNQYLKCDNNAIKQLFDKFPEAKTHKDLFIKIITTCPRKKYYVFSNYTPGNKEKPLKEYIDELNQNVLFSTAHMAFEKKAEVQSFIGEQHKKLHVRGGMFAMPDSPMFIVFEATIPTQLLALAYLNGVESVLSECHLIAHHYDGTQFIKSIPIAYLNGHYELSNQNAASAAPSPHQNNK